MPHLHRDSQASAIAFNCSIREEIMFFISAFQGSGDNLMIAELCSHMGLKAIFFCSHCHIGGMQVFKASTEGYHSLFPVSAIGHLSHMSFTDKAAQKPMDCG